ncbi:uncharacterized protein LOC144887779 [Branchiostoma floridae x Branchiostoma japonicum]
MDENRLTLHQECPAGTVATLKDQPKDVTSQKKTKISSPGAQADISPISKLVNPTSKNKHQKRLPHKSCSRTVTYDCKTRTFVARKSKHKCRRVERVKIATQHGHSNSVIQKKPTARKTTNPGCPLDLVKTKAVQLSERIQPKEKMDVTKLYTKLQCTEGSVAESHLIHQSKTGENLPQVTTRRAPLQNRRNCWLGSPRIPDGYPHFHGNKKVRQKTARASLRNAISARHVKYSSMHLPHKVQKVQLKCCTERQHPAGEKKGNNSTFSLNGENTAKRPGKHCNLSNDKPGESVTCSLPHANSMVVRKCSVTTGQKLESVVSRLWATVCHSGKEQGNTTENISGPKAQKLQYDMSEMIDYGDMEKANNCRQQDCSFQTVMDNPRKPASTEVDRLYSGEKSWTGQAEGGGICKEGLSLRLCSTLETSEPTCGEIMEGRQADVEEPPTLEWMGGGGSPICHSNDTSPPKLDRIPRNLSISDPVTVPILRMSADPSVTGKSEETISCLLKQEVGTTLPDTSTSPQGYVCSTSEVVRPENYRCTAEQVQNSELLTFPQDPYPDVDKVNGQYFMSFSNQEALEAHKTVEARVEKEFRLDSRVFIQDVMEYKLLYGKQKKKKRKHKAPEGWNPGLHNRHTRYNMMLVEEVLKKRVILSGICTQAAVQIDPTQTANTNQTSCVSYLPAAIMAPPSKRRKGGDGLVSKLLGCENLHWKRKARLMWDMVQAGTRHDMVQAGTRHDMVQAGTRHDMVQAGTRHDMVQAGTRHDMVQAGTRHDMVQAGTRHDMVQAGTRHDMVQAGTRHDMVQAGTSHDMVQAGTRHDMVQAGTRHDMVQAGTRHDMVQAGTRHDMVQAGTRHDMVQAGTRHDMVQAGTRHDMVQAGTRHDMVQAGTRHDMVQAGTSHDMVQAGTRHDMVQAGTRHDMVKAGTRHDMVQAGTSHDMIQAGTRHDMVQAGTSHDMVQAGTSHDMVQAGTSHDMVQAGTRHDMVQAGTRHDMVQAGTRHDMVQAGTRHVMMQAGTRHDMVQAGTRHDMVQAGTRHVMMQAGTRHDMVQAGTRHVMMQAGARHDMVQAGTRHVMMQAGTRHDMVQAGTRHDMVQAGTGHDMVQAGIRDVMVQSGNRHKMALEHAGTRHNNIQAGSRHDMIHAGTSHNMIQAGTRYHMSSSGVAEEGGCYHGNTESQYNTTGDDDHQFSLSGDGQPAEKSPRTLNYFGSEDIQAENKLQVLDIQLICTWDQGISLDMCLKHNGQQ